MAAEAQVARPGIRSVARAAEILRLLADGRRRGAAEIADELGIARGTIHDVLRTLRHEGLVDQDPESGRYCPGPALLAFGAGHLRCSPLRAASLNAARSLASRTGETARVGLLHRERVLIVHLAAATGAPGDAGVDLGALEPVTSTALGRALTTRAATWALEEPAAGIAGIAAPIATETLAEPSAIGIQGPVERLCPDGVPRGDLLQVVVDAARAVARELGGDRW